MMIIMIMTYRKGHALIYIVLLFLMMIGAIATKRDVSFYFCHKRKHIQRCLSVSHDDDDDDDERVMMMMMMMMMKG